MKILIINTSFFHHKNKIGLNFILNFLGIEYLYGDESNIINYDIIYNPSAISPHNLYPNKKFIYGPHFSVFPTILYNSIINNHKNIIYIQPSQWVVDNWSSHKYNNPNIPIFSFPFPVDTNKFIEIKNIKKNKVFIYYKNRHSDDLLFITNYLLNKRIKFSLFDYTKKYKENNYLYTLQKSKYGIWIGCHESQGLALEEALSCNVPLLVFNVSSLIQEYNTNYDDLYCTSIPYWDKTCGEIFYTKDEFENKFNIFLNNLHNYTPRKYILEHLSIDVCSQNFLNLLNKF